MSARVEPKGVKTRIFGVILIFVAMMNAMLHWRGGFDLGTGAIVLFVAGISFYAIGAVLGGRNRQRITETDQ
jgi:hypothetical protein